MGVELNAKAVGSGKCARTPGKFNISGCQNKDFLPCLPRFALVNVFLPKRNFSMNLGITSSLIHLNDWVYHSVICSGSVTEAKGAVSIIKKIRRFKSFIGV